MTRWLVAGLLAEGDSDLWFLGTLIQRQLEDFSRQAETPFDVPDLIPSSCATVRSDEEVSAAVAEMVADCDVVFVHHDHREELRIQPIHDRLTTGSGAVVPVVPVRETEAWIIADRSTLAGLSGTRPDGLPARPKDAERLCDPKRTLAAALPDKAGRQNLEDWFRLLGQLVCLDVLARVPAYAEWRTQTERKLKELRFL